MLKEESTAQEDYSDPFENFLKSRYQQAQNITQEFEKDLFMLLNSSQNSKDPSNYIQACKAFYTKGEHLYQLLISLEELTRPFLTVLHKDVTTKFRLQLVKGYCLCFHANQLLNYILDTEHFPSNWRQVSSGLNKIYRYFSQEFHTDTKTELYLCQTLILILQEATRSSTFLDSNEEATTVAETIKVFIDALTNTTTSTVKMHSLIFLFSLQNDHKTKPFIEYLATENVEADDYFFKQFMPLVQKRLETADNQFIYFYAYATILCNKLYAINNKLVYESGKNRKNQKESHSPKNTCIINVQNDETLLNYLNKIQEDSKIIEGIILLGNFDHTKDSCQFHKIFQSKEIYYNLIALYKQCLGMINNITSMILEKNKNETDKFKMNYSFLKYRKEILCLMLKLDAEYGNETESTELTLQQLDVVICEIFSLESQKDTSLRRQNELFNAPTTIAPTTAPKDKTTKKLNKEKKIREAFRAAKNNNKPNFKAKEEQKEDPNKIPFNNAFKKFIEGDFHQALELYQNLYEQNSEDTNLEAVSILICLGDIYSKLDQTASSDSEKTEYLQKAIEHYRKAEARAKILLTIHSESETRQQIETFLDIAKDLAQKLSADPASPSDPSKEIKPTQAEQRTSAPSMTKKNNEIALAPPPTIVSKKIPVPEFFNKLKKILEQHGYYVLLVGGYVRDFLLQEKAYDIDVVVHNPHIEGNKQNLFTQLAALIQSKYPNAEIRSKKYPIIYIQHQDIIIELSLLKHDFEIKKTEHFDDKQLFSLLYQDAKSRDTTDNAIYAYLKKNKLIDFFNGIKHLDGNELHSIAPSHISFEEDVTRIFRVLRSIIRRSIKNPHLIYSSRIIDAMNLHTKKLYLLNKDRCYLEIHKLLFRGNALATWQFLVKMGLQHAFFLLPPESSTITMKHSFMVGKTLANLDQRIKNNLNYNPALVFAVLLWGCFQEQFEKMPKEDNVKILKQTHQLSENLLSNSGILFRLPADICAEIKRIWHVYLSTNNIVKDDNLKFNFHDFRISHVFKHLVTQAMRFAPEEKVKHLLTSNKSNFFKCYKLEYLAREIIRDNNLILETSSQRFTISLPHMNGIVIAREKEILLNNLKHNIQIILGRFGISYQLQGDCLCLSTDSVLRSRSIAHLMEFLFEPMPMKNNLTYK